MENISICKICNEKVINDNHYYKKHKVSAAEYYQTHFERRDLFDNSLIKFKNKEFYFNSDFNSKTNLRNWLLKAYPDDVKSYLKDYLVNRKEKKGLIYAPSQVELRSLPIPGIKYFNDVFGDYNELCLSLGFKVRFKQKNFNKKSFTNVDNKFIFKDSREQLGLDFNNRVRTKGLKFGDYSMKGCSIVIERKSLGDFWGTLTGGYERFCREIDRAKEANSYLVVVIEEPFNEVYAYPYRRQVYGKIKISPEMPLHNMREIMQKYENVQFLFVDNREEASKTIELIFSAGEQCRDIDLQYHKDIGKL